MHILIPIFIWNSRMNDMIRQMIVFFRFIVWSFVQFAANDYTDNDFNDCYHSHEIHKYEERKRQPPEIYFGKKESVNK